MGRADTKSARHCDATSPGGGRRQERERKEVREGGWGGGKAREREGQSETEKRGGEERERSLLTIREREIERESAHALKHASELMRKDLQNERETER